MAVNRALPAGPVGLIEALEEPRLLKGAIELLPRQRELLEQVEVCSRNVWCLGRRSGKSSLAALVLVWQACLRPDLRECVRDDEAIYCVSVAANKEQARVVLAAAKRSIHSSPVLAGLVEREVDDAIFFRNGNVISAFVCSSRSTRGFPIAALVLDEMSWMQSSEDGPQAAASVYRALAPAQAQFGSERRLILSSTPNGDGVFREMFDDALAARSEGRPGVACFQLPSWEVRPDIPMSVFDEERGPLGEQWEAEFGAQFLNSGAALLSEADIRDCVVERGDLTRLEGTDWVCGLDVGFRQDRSAAVILGRSRDDRERLLVAAIRTWEPVSAADKALGVERHAEYVLSQVAALAQEYRASVFADTYEAETVKARLRRHGVGCDTVSTGAGVKGSMYRELAAKVRLGQIEIPDHPTLIGELRRLKVDYRGSAPTVQNPRADRGHGDVAAALGMAVFNIAHSRSPALAAPTIPVRYPGYLTNGPGAFDPSPIDSWQF
jgi:hypothetical protein